VSECRDVSHSNPAGPFRVLLNMAALALGSLAMWLSAAPLFPPPQLPVLSEKRAHFLANAGGYDTVFIGSSRIYRGFVPAVFDEEMRARGQPARSFNFAMEAVWPPESFYRVREFLRLRQPVRWLFIELLPVNPRISPQNARTLRSIYWHDGRHTLLAWREVAGEDTFTSGEKLAWCALHADLFGRRLSNVSRAAALLERQLCPELAKTAKKEFAFNTPWLEADGFVPEPATPMAAATADSFRQAVASYARTLASVALPEHLRTELRALVAEVRQAGATPVFVITPSITRAENFADLRAQGIEADLISFKDPARYPALYDPALHFDGPHLNERGARELSRLLAEEFATRLAQ
jgi:hypothetical protein